MFAALNHFEASVAVLLPGAIVYLLLVLLVSRLSRSLERMLIFCGLLTAVFAAWSSLVSIDAAMEVRGGQAAVTFGGHASGLLGRVAVLLILGGLAIVILERTARPSVSRKEEGIRVAE